MSDSGSPEPRKANLPLALGLAVAGGLILGVSSGNSLEGFGLGIVLGLAIALGLDFVAGRRS
jgi:hypothetical protein